MINGVKVLFSLHEENFGAFEVISCGEYPPDIIEDTVGGWSSFKKVDEKIEKISKKIWKKVSEFSGKLILTFEIKKYKQ